MVSSRRTVDGASLFVLHLLDRDILFCLEAAAVFGRRPLAIVLQQGRVAALRGTLGFYQTVARIVGRVSLLTSTGAIFVHN